MLLSGFQMILKTMQEKSNFWKASDFTTIFPTFISLKKKKEDLSRFYISLDYQDFAVIYIKIIYVFKNFKRKQKENKVHDTRT